MVHSRVLGANPIFGSTPPNSLLPSSSPSIHSASSHLIHRHLIPSHLISPNSSHPASHLTPISIPKCMSPRWNAFAYHWRQHPNPPHPAQAPLLSLLSSIPSHPYRPIFTHSVSSLISSRLPSLSLTSPHISSCRIIHHRCLQGPSRVGQGAAPACSSSRPLFSPSAWAALAASRCSARVQLIALTGVTLAAACSFSSLIISATVLALGLGVTGRLAPLGAYAAHCPDRPDALSRMQLQLSHHLSRCSRPRLGQHWPPRAARRACSSSP